MGEAFFTSDATWYLAAILGLLGLWLFHYAQVRAGRIQAIDLFDRSLVRMYVYVTTGEGPACRVCANAHGRVFLSTQVGKKKFSPLDGPCTGKVPCQGCLVGLYGGWSEARELVARVQKVSKRVIVRLAPEELQTLVKGQWKSSVSAETDRISVNMLEALCEDQSHSDIAIEGYRHVIGHAKDERHVSLIVPAYLRLLSVLLRAGREEETRRVIEEFERRFPIECRESHAPNSNQRQLLEEKKALLWERQSLHVSA